VDERELNFYLSGCVIREKEEPGYEVGFKTKRFSEKKEDDILLSPKV